MKKFITELNPNYKLPSRDTLTSRIFTKAATDLFLQRGDKIKGMKDVTICLDGWEDVSHNSVYAFMILKNDSEDILDIVDFSRQRPNVENLKNKLYEVMHANLLEPSSIIAIVTDNPSTMVSCGYKTINE